MRLNRAFRVQLPDRLSGRAAKRLELGHKLRGMIPAAVTWRALQRCKLDRMAMFEKRVPVAFRVRAGSAELHSSRAFDPLDSRVRSRQSWLPE